MYTREFLLFIFGRQPRSILSLLDLFVSLYVLWVKMLYPTIEKMFYNKKLKILLVSFKALAFGKLYLFINASLQIHLHFFKYEG